ncbi:MAG: hypothetical protein AAF573_08440 [Bacteroidota bacterium]
MKSIKIYLSLLLVAVLLITCTDEANDFAVQNQSPFNLDTGVAGSYARFMIVDDFLYIVDNQDIRTYSLDNAEEPTLVNEQNIGERIESIFHREGKLFIGSGIGLFIYTIQENGIPEFTSTFSYDVFPILPCDPVVANATHAFVTLNSSTISTVCRATVTNQINQLNIFDITDISNPILINEIQMFRPKGLGLDGNTLFVCDDDMGLKVFDVSDVLDVKLIAHFDTFNAYDVIPLGGLLLVVGPENVYQFDYTDLDDIQLLSTIQIEA